MTIYAILSDVASKDLDKYLKAYGEQGKTFLSEFTKRNIVKNYKASNKASQKLEVVKLGNSYKLHLLGSGTYKAFSGTSFNDLMKANVNLREYQKLEVAYKVLEELIKYGITN